MTRCQTHPSPLSSGKPVKGLALCVPGDCGAPVTPIPADCIPPVGMFQSRSQTTACDYQTCSEPLGRLHAVFLGRDRESLPTHGIHPAGAEHGGTRGQTATQISAVVVPRLILTFSHQLWMGAAHSQACKTGIFLAQLIYPGKLSFLQGNSILIQVYILQNTDSSWT